MQQQEMFRLRINSPITLQTTRTMATAEDYHQAKPIFLAGKGPRKTIGILMVHGFTISPACFYAYAQKLNQEDYTVSVPLLPGHGQTPAALNDVSASDWFAHLENEYQYLKDQCDHIIIIGISLGGSLALQLAAKYDIKKLLLIAPLVYPITLLKIGRYFLMPLLRLLGIRYWTNVAGDVRRQDGFELGYAKTSIHGLNELYQSMLQTRSILPQVQSPTIIFQGQKDNEVPPNKATSILKQIATNNKELVWLADSGHEVPRDHNSEFVLAKITQEVDDLFQTINLNKPPILTKNYANEMT